MAVVPRQPFCQSADGEGIFHHAPLFPFRKHVLVGSPQSLDVMPTVQPTVQSRHGLFMPLPFQNDHFIRLLSEKRGETPKSNSTDTARLSQGEVRTATPTLEAKHQMLVVPWCSQKEHIVPVQQHLTAEIPTKKRSTSHWTEDEHQRFLKVDSRGLPMLAVHPFSHLCSVFRPTPFMAMHGSLWR